jgi:hypothetical protein
VNATNILLLAAVVGVAGQYAKGQGFSLKTGVGGIVAAIFVTVISNVDAKLGMGFAGAVLVTALSLYAVPIAQQLGYAPGGTIATPGSLSSNQGNARSRGAN